MKQNKIKLLSPALVVILVLALALVFAACNPNNNETTPGGNSGNPGEQGTNPGKNDPPETQKTGLANVISEEQFNSIYGYLYSVDLGKNGFINAYSFYCSADGLKNGEDLGDDGMPPAFETRNGVAIVWLLIFSGEYDKETSSYADEKSVAMFFFGSSEEATDGLTKIKEYADNQRSDEEESENSNNEDEAMVYHTVGNVAVVENEEGLFENHVMKATLPNTVSNSRKNVLKQAYEKLREAYWGNGYYEIDAEDGLNINAFGFEPKHGNCKENLVYYTCETDEIEDVKKEFNEESKFYTSDSYVDTTSEPGYIFYYFKFKPGFVYEKDDHNEGIIKIGAYYHDEDVVENLVIPAKLDGHEISEVKLVDDDHIKSVSVEEGIETVWISSDALTSIKLPESVKDLHLSFGSSLTQLTLPSSLESLSLYAESMELPSFPSSLKNLSLQIDSLTTLTLPATLNSVYLRCKTLNTINYSGSTADFEEMYGDEVKYWCNVSLYNSTTSKYTNIELTISVVCNDGTLICTKDGIQNS